MAATSPAQALPLSPATIPPVSKEIQEVAVHVGSLRHYLEHVVGEGGYGIVYRGNLGDGYQVAVKNLLNNRGQAEREFKVEVEAIGRVRHKKLVRLLGYCAEGAHRILVYEYVDNQPSAVASWRCWIVGLVSPLSWDIRMNIVLGTAKGFICKHLKNC